MCLCVERAGRHVHHGRGRRVLLLHVQGLVRQYSCCREGGRRGIRSPAASRRGASATPSLSSDLFVSGTVTLMRTGLAAPNCSIRRLDGSLYVRQAKLCGGLATLLSGSPDLFVQDVHLRQTTRLVQRKRVDVARVTSYMNFDSANCVDGYFRRRCNYGPSRCTAGMGGSA